jgi:outer membrane translocation and assembly module TamA
MKIHFGFLCFILFFGIDSYGQKKINLVITISDTTNFDRNFLEKEFAVTKSFKDTIQLNEFLQTTLIKLNDEGFLSAGIDSVIKDSINYHAFLFAGDKYTWAYLTQGNVDEEYLEGTGFRKKLYSGRPFRYDQVATLNSKILRNCENKGFPFANITLDSIKINGKNFSAALSLKQNRFVRIDSVILKGTATVAPVYLFNYIGIKHGDVYKENQIRKVSSRLRELPFLKEVKSSQVLFTEKETKLYLFLENKKASQFDGVIGLLPDEAKSGKFNITGEAHLKLQNSLKRGEIIELNWKQLPAKTQDLKVHALYPFLFNTPFGLDGRLAIFKKDSTYIDVTKTLGIQYSFTGSNFLKAFINDKQSDLQSAKGLENITILPAYADITTISYGATIHYEKLDYRLNPRNGFYIEATGSTGNRKIRKNIEINSVVYDSLKLTSVTYQGEIIADYFISLGGRHVVDLGTNSGYIYNPQLFVNELYRIGGLKSLRGFDEESIYASTYIIGKVEYRYLLEQNSFLFAFVNSAWYENKSRNTEITDRPIGFGAGIDFETKIGIMSVSYALGKQFNNPVFFRNGKIHFGIVNYF